MPKKRADGRYQAKVKTGRYTDDGTPEYKIVYGRTKADLDAAKDAARRKSQLGDFRDSTTDEWLSEWLNIKQAEVDAGDLEERTYEDYETIVRRHIKPIIGNLPLDKIQPMQIRNLLKTKRESGLSDRRVQAIYVTVNAALAQAVKDRAITWNPCASVTKPTVERRKYIIITQKQYNLIINEAKRSTMRPLFMLAWDTGLRLGELLGLPWRCIDFKKHTIKVDQKVTRTKTLGVHISTRLKSEYAGRTVPVTDEVLRELAAHHTRQAAHILEHGLTYQKQYDLVFPQADGRPKDTRDVSQLFKDMITRLKLPDGIHFHDLRHTYASTLAELDIHPKKMQFLLGHATAAFTMDTYVHKTDDMLKGVKEKLEKKRRGSQKAVTTHQI